MKYMLRHVKPAPEGIVWDVSKERNFEVLFVTKRESAPGPDRLPYQHKQIWVRDRNAVPIRSLPANLLWRPPSNWLPGQQDCFHLEVQGC